VVDRVSVPEAAKLLGISEGAVRQRMHRGQLQYDKDENGRVYVYPTAVDTTNNDVKTADDALVDELRDRIRFLEQELADRKEEALRRDEEAKRKDAILMTLAQRVPELEAPSETVQSPTTAANGEEQGIAAPDAENRSWWRRIFQ
jgi:predicted transcriptional regulator